MRIEFQSRVPLLTCACLLLASCLVGPQSKRGTVVDNESRMGVIFLANGSPAVNAKVRVIPVSHIPDTSADSSSPTAGTFTTRTDSNGAYQVDSLPKGEYNIMASLDNLAAFQDSVYLGGNSLAIPPDTLAQPGSVSGVVALQPNHDPRAALVQLLGTNIYANVREDGSFTLADLGGGRYSLRVVTSYSEYVPLIIGVSVAAGRAETIPDTLRPAFLGIPVVMGLRATYDTLSGVVSLSWSASHYRDFSDYLIYRDPSPALELTSVPIALTRDTLYRDSLKHSPGAFDSSGVPKNFEYRIRIQDKSDQKGMSYGKAVVTAVPPLQVTTRIVLSLDSQVWDGKEQGDSITVSANLANGGRDLAWMQWQVDSDTLPRESLDHVRAATRKMKFLWTKQTDARVSVSVVDDAGHPESAFLGVRGNRAPRLEAAKDTVLKTYTGFRLAAKASDPDGDTLRYAIRNKPAWAKFDTSTGVLSGTLGAGDTGTYSGIVLEASDGRRTTATDPFRIKVVPNPWTPGPDIPASAGPVKAVAMDGKVYLISDSIRVLDSLTGTWKTLIGIPDSLSGQGAIAAVNGKIVSFFHSRNSINQYVPMRAVLFDPHSNSLVVQAHADWPSYVLSGAVSGTLFYAFMNGNTWIYDAEAESWSRRNIPNGFSGLTWDQGACIDLGGKVFITGQYDSDMSLSYLTSGGVTSLYDPTSDTWTALAPISPRVWGAISLLNGLIFYAGGMDQSGGPSNRVEAFNPVTGTWMSRSPMPASRVKATAVQMNGKMLILGGSTNIEGAPTTTSTFIYDPALDP